MNAPIAIALAIALLATGAPVAIAAPSSPMNLTPAEQSQCQPDVFRLCNDAVPDDQAVAACMTAKRKQLSPECRKVFESHVKKGK